MSTTAAEGCFTFHLPQLRRLPNWMLGNATLFFAEITQNNTGARRFSFAIPPSVRVHLHASRKHSISQDKPEKLVENDNSKKIAGGFVALLSNFGLNRRAFNALLSNDICAICHKLSYSESFISSKTKKYSIQFHLFSFYFKAGSLL